MVCQPVEIALADPATVIRKQRLDRRIFAVRVQLGQMRRKVVAGHRLRAVPPQFVHQALAQRGLAAALLSADEDAARLRDPAGLRGKRWMDPVAEKRFPVQLQGHSGHDPNWVTLAPEERASGSGRGRTAVDRVIGGLPDQNTDRDQQQDRDDRIDARRRLFGNDFRFFDRKDRSSGKGRGGKCGDQGRGQCDFHQSSFLQFTGS